MSIVLNRISSETVKKATGKTWDELLAVLDKEGAKDMAHKDIAQLLWDKNILQVVGGVRW